jgi:NADH-quinone oxidoreductase subunit N
VSLAGLPPLAGFFGKFYLFAAAFRSGGLVWLVVIALFGSLLSLYYYLTILKAMYLPRTTVTQTLTPRPGFLQQSVLSLAAGLVLFFGLAPSFLLARIIASLA